MSVHALFMLVITQTIVSGFTIYFFWRVLSSKKNNSDSKVNSDTNDSKTN